MIIVNIIQAFERHQSACRWCSCGRPGARSNTSGWRTSWGRWRKLTRATSSALTSSSHSLRASLTFVPSCWLVFTFFSPSLVFFHHLNSSKPKYFGRMNSFHIFSLVHFLADTENNHSPLITTHKSLCVCIYCVFSPPPYLQYMAERHFQRVSGTSLFTGLRAITHFSRPDFANIFQSIKKRYFKVSFRYLFNNRHCFTVNHFLKNLSNTNNRVKIL